MIIKKMAVGNSEEAFILDSFHDGVNIISSDENNKGKTITIQSMMYAIGNEPAFPTTFDADCYLHYLEFDEHGETIKICRNMNSYTLRQADKLMFFNSVSELKRYWAKNICALPCVVKDSIRRIVDPVLFLQLFFVGQDKRDTSKLTGTSYYNKTDFVNMLFDLIDAGISTTDEMSIEESQNEITRLKEQKKIIQRSHKILKDTNQASSYLSVIADREAFGKKLQELEQTKDKITQLKSERDAIANKKLQWERIKKELRSLNRTLDCGELRCMDCNSSNIAFKASKRARFSFDVSTVAMRTEILNSVQAKVDAYAEDLEVIQKDIETVEKYLQNLLREEDISIEALILYKQDIINAEEAEQQLIQIDDRLRALQERIEIHDAEIAENRQKQEEFIQNILNAMSELYKEIDPNGTLSFDGLFTKKDQTYSGSEMTIFYIVRLLALQKILRHSFPIIMDSFRSEDLSTWKEDSAIKLFKECGNQVILTTTLKKEELGKYDSNPDVHHIDFQDHTESHMLTPDYCNEFKSIVSVLGINL